MIFAQISRIDLSIWQKWTDLYRANVPEGITFNRCMKRVDTTADTLWSTDLSRDMHPNFNHNGGKGEGKLDKFAKTRQ